MLSKIDRSPTALKGYRLHKQLKLQLHELRKIVMGVDSGWTFQEDPGAWHFIGISQGGMFLTVGAWLSP